MGAHEEGGKEVDGAPIAPSDSGLVHPLKCEEIGGTRGFSTNGYLNPTGNVQRFKCVLGVLRQIYYIGWRLRLCAIPTAAYKKDFSNAGVLREVDALGVVGTDYGLHVIAIC